MIYHCLNAIKTSNCALCLSCILTCPKESDLLLIETALEIPLIDCYHVFHCLNSFPNYRQLTKMKNDRIPHNEIGTQTKQPSFEYFITKHIFHLTKCIQTIYNRINIVSDIS